MRACFCLKRNENYSCHLCSPTKLLEWTSLGPSLPHSLKPSCEVGFVFGGRYFTKLEHISLAEKVGA